MSDPGGSDRESAPIDYDVLERIARRFEGSEQFAAVERRPPYAPSSLVFEYDAGYFPAAVERATLEIRWYENDDFNAHYVERYADGTRWECRWDRHPNEHNAREHFHPPPDAVTPGRDADYADDWRDVLAAILSDLNDRIRAFWE